MRRLFVPTAVAALVVAGQAVAHAHLIAATPRAGSLVTAPRQLRLAYSESILPEGSRVAVAGPGGVTVGEGPLTVDSADRRVVTVPFTTRLGPGAYTVTWLMTAADGHQTDGGFTFVVKP